MLHRQASTMSNNAENSMITLKIIKLKEALQQSFPIIDQKKNSFELYPFSNEGNYLSVLKTLEATNPKKTSKIRVAILFGESNFLSMIPELSKHADLILLGDIEFRLHKHTKHLLDCLNKSNNPNEFINYYEINNPIENESLDWLTTSNLGVVPIATIQILKDLLLGRIEATADSLTDEKHFLLSKERYTQCKNSYKNLSFTHIDFDLMDSKKALILADLLKNFNAEITLCNFTNIHDYDKKGKKLSASIPILLQNSNEYFVMYSTNEKTEDSSGRKLIRNLQTDISLGLLNYFKYALEKPMTEQQYTKNISLNPTISSFSFFNRQEICGAPVQTIKEWQEVNCYLSESKEVQSAGPGYSF